MEPSARVHQWLTMLSKSKLEQFPLFTKDYKILQNLCGVPYVRVLKNHNQEARVFFVDRQQAIDMLKDRYGFKTKQEAERELRDGLDI
jgi:hypothetical protein